MTDFKFADIGEGIHEGVILKWFFEVGDTVKEGDTIVIIETDKVNAEIPSPESLKSVKPSMWVKPSSSLVKKAIALKRLKNPPLLKKLKK